MRVGGEQEADVEFGVKAGGSTAGDETAAGSQAFQAMFPGGGANMFDDNIDASIVGKAANFLGNGHDEVMDDFIGAEFTCLGEFFVVAGSGDDAGTVELCDLDCGAAHTASGSKDQDGFTGQELRAVHEHVPRGYEYKRDSGGMGPIQILRTGEAIDLRHANIFCAAAIDHVAEVGEITAAVILAGDTGGTFATSDAWSENDFLADVNGGDFGADLANLAGNIAARNVRERNGNAGESAANPEVQMIEGAGMNADEDFIVAEMWFGNIGVAKDRRIAVLMEDDGFHVKPPRNVGECARKHIYRITICLTKPVALPRRISDPRRA